MNTKQITPTTIITAFLMVIAIGMVFLLAYSFTTPQQDVSRAEIGMPLMIEKTTPQPAIGETRVNCSPYCFENSNMVLIFNADGSVAGKVMSGVTVEILQTQGNLLKIRSEGLVGWIQNTYTQ